MPNKFIGLLNAWNAGPFIKPILNMAVEYCDEVLVAVGPHSEAMKKYDDGTEKVAKKFKDKVTFVPVQFGGTHLTSKTPTMNMMLEKSEMFEVGNWVWLLDTDEFYFKDDVSLMKKSLSGSDYNTVSIANERFFFINMKHYLTNTNKIRLWKITDKSNHFLPLQRWTGETDKVYTFDTTMHHYSLLLNPYSKREFWRTEYNDKTQDIKVKWMDEIYMKFELNNQEKWIERNEMLFGKRTPFMQSDYNTNDGGLFKYEGEHPEHIQDTRLLKIKDFRNIYIKK